MLIFAEMMKVTVLDIAVITNDGMSDGKSGHRHQPPIQSRVTSRRVVMLFHLPSSVPPASLVEKSLSPSILFHRMMALTHRVCRGTDTAEHVAPVIMDHSFEIGNVIGQKHINVGPG